MEKLFFKPVCWPLFIRMSQYVPNFRFFNVFLIMQAHFHSKVPKHANFRRSLQYSRAEIKLCANFLALRCDKTQQGSYDQVLQNMTWQFSLKDILFLNSKIIIFTFLANVPKMPKDMAKRPDIKVVFKSCQTFAEQNFLNLGFVKVGMLW